MSHMVTAMPNVFLILLHMFLLIILIQFAVINGVRLAHPCDTLGVLTPPRTNMPGHWSWPGLPIGEAHKGTAHRKVMDSDQLSGDDCM